MKGLSPGTLPLAIEDDVLTGTLFSRNHELEIEEAYIEGDRIHFNESHRDSFLSSTPK